MLSGLIGTQSPSSTFHAVGGSVLKSHFIIFIPPSRFETALKQESPQPIQFQRQLLLIQQLCKTGFSLR